MFKIECILNHGLQPRGKMRSRVQCEAVLRARRHHRPLVPVNEPSAKTHTSTHAPYHRLTPVYISDYHKRSLTPMHHRSGWTIWPGGVRDNMGVVHLPPAGGHGHESPAGANLRCPLLPPRPSSLGFSVCSSHRPFVDGETNVHKGVFYRRVSGECG